VTRDVVELRVRVSDMPEFAEFVAAAGAVVRAFDEVRDHGAGTGLGVAIENLRSAMLELADEGTR